MGKSCGSLPSGLLCPGSNSTSLPRKISQRSKFPAWGPDPASYPLRWVVPIGREGHLQGISWPPRNIVQQCTAWEVNRSSFYHHHYHQFHHHQSNQCNQVTLAGPHPPHHLHFPRPLHLHQKPLHHNRNKDLKKLPQWIISCRASPEPLPAFFSSSLWSFTRRLRPICTFLALS